MPEMDLIADGGNVIIRDWTGDHIDTEYIMTPTAARLWSRKLLELADEADAQMPGTSAEPCACLYRCPVEGDCEECGGQEQ